MSTFKNNKIDGFQKIEPLNSTLICSGWELLASIAAEFFFSSDGLMNLRYVYFEKIEVLIVFFIILI